MRLSALLPLLLSHLEAQSVLGKCTICPDGPEDPDADPSGEGILTCSTIDSLYENITHPAECAGYQLSFMPKCCPSQLGKIAKNNPCGWCPDGVADINMKVQLPFSTKTVTCSSLMVGTLAVAENVDDVCAFYESVAPSCCPAEGAAAVSACEFCPSGLENPIVIASSEGSCQQIKEYADHVFDGDMCQGSFKPVESLCCPGTTKNYMCKYCSDGIEYPDDWVDEGIKCSELRLFSKLANETDCANIKFTEALCCPSSTDISIPPVEEGDYCHICGSATVEMKRPDYRPFAIGDTDIPENMMTCAEIEKEMNDKREPGSSCRNVIGSFTLFFSPSICGCEGFEAPNDCGICDGGILNRNTMVPGQNFTCGEGFVFLQHASAAFCDASEEVDLEGIDATCCNQDSSIQGNSATSRDDDAAILFGSHVTFMMMLVLMGRTFVT